MEGYTYFDNNATTPVDSRVAEAMLPWLTTQWGNASSMHRIGRRARHAIDCARISVARALSAEPIDILFTASGTEANNAVIFEAARVCDHAGELIVSVMEHPSIQRAADRCEERGMTVHRLSPGPDGVVSAEAVAQRLGPRTRLVCLMLANNELGTIQPIEAVSALCRERGVPMLCDAVQGVGKLEVDVRRLGVDFLTLGAHKFHGPLGAAALWVRPGAEFGGWMLGGGQERRLRAGTANVAAIVGLGKACDLVVEELDERRSHLQSLLDRFEAGLADIPDIVVHCAGSARLPHTSNIAVLGVAADELMMRLDAAGFAVSTGSACGSAGSDGSPTVRSLGVPVDEARASLRVSFGSTNTLEEVDRFLPVLAREAAALRRTVTAR